MIADDHPLVYLKLTFDSFQRKLSSFGLTLKDKRAIENYPFVAVDPKHTSEVDEIVIWCDETFGDDWIWRQSLVTGNFHFHFKTKEDAFLCGLKYGSKE